jgi:glycosyltransferase involved in cell wall biosynthesis
LQLANSPDITIIIVAPEPYRTIFNEMHNVTFLSGVSDEQLVSLYQRASCLLMTAENATANNAILEAMACGLPIISERVGGIPEYVDETCGFLTTPSRAEELCTAILNLSSTPSRATAMGNASRAVAESLDWTRVALKHADVYRSLQPSAD